MDSKSPSFAQILVLHFPQNSLGEDFNNGQMVAIHRQRLQILSFNNRQPLEAFFPHVLIRHKALSLKGPFKFVDALYNFLDHLVCVRISASRALADKAVGREGLLTLGGGI